MKHGAFDNTSTLPGRNVLKMNFNLINYITSFLDYPTRLTVSKTNKIFSDKANIKILFQQMQFLDDINIFKIIKDYSSKKKLEFLFSYDELINKLSTQFGTNNELNKIGLIHYVENYLMPINVHNFMISDTKTVEVLGHIITSFPNIFFSQIYSKDLKFIPNNNLNLFKYFQVYYSNIEDLINYRSDTINVVDLKILGKNNSIIDKFSNLSISSPLIHKIFLNFENLNNFDLTLNTLITPNINSLKYLSIYIRFVHNFNLDKINQIFLTFKDRVSMGELLIKIELPSEIMSSEESVAKIIEYFKNCKFISLLILNDIVFYTNNANLTTSFELDLDIEYKNIDCLNLFKFTNVTEFNQFKLRWDYYTEELDEKSILYLTNISRVNTITLDVSNSSGKKYVEIEGGVIGNLDLVLSNLSIAARKLKVMDWPEGHDHSIFSLLDKNPNLTVNFNDCRKEKTLKVFSKQKYNNSYYETDEKSYFEWKNIEKMFRNKKNICVDFENYNFKKISFSGWSQDSLLCLKVTALRYCNYNSKYVEEDLESFMSVVPYSLNLEELSISCENPMYIDSEVWKSFGEDLSKLTKMRKLNFHFDFDEEPENIDRYQRSVLENLSSLVLKELGFGKIGDLTLDYIVNNLDTKFKELKTIRSFKVGDSEINLSKLKERNINFK